MRSATRHVLRFAPTPNGRLHLGHAYSALMNERTAARLGGRVLLRMEDLDRARCTPDLEAGVRDDLAWLGVGFDGAVRRQSEHTRAYADALDILRARGLLYACACGRADVAKLARGAQDPEGAARHPRAAVVRLPREGAETALRLDTARALAEIGGTSSWRECGEGDEARRVEADPFAWGDVVLRGKFVAASYHIAVVIDDAAQGVTDIVRGSDLFAATSVHRLLQALLGLPEPTYRHHRLVLDGDAGKLSKSRASPSLASLRERGDTSEAIRAALGFAEGRRARASFSSSWTPS